MIADAAAPPAFVAADLLSQAEHGKDSQVVLVALPGVDLEAVANEVETQRAALPRGDIAAEALGHSFVVKVDDKATAAQVGGWSLCEWVCGVWCLCVCRVGVCVCVCFERRQKKVCVVVGTRGAAPASSSSQKTVEIALHASVCVCVLCSFGRAGRCERSRNAMKRSRAAKGDSRSPSFSSTITSLTALLTTHPRI